MKLKYFLIFVVLAVCINMLMIGLFGSTGYFANRALMEVRDNEEKRIELLRKTNSALKESEGNISLESYQDDDEVTINIDEIDYFRGIPVWAQWALSVVLAMIITLLFALPDKEQLIRKHERPSAKHAVRNVSQNTDSGETFADSSFNRDEHEMESIDAVPSDSARDKCLIISRNDINATKEIVKILDNHGIVIMPCDTIYGIVGLADEVAGQKIDEVKNRPAEKRYITLATLNMVSKLVDGPIPKGVMDMWPGPFTAILKAKEGGTIAVRVPKDTLVTDVITTLDKPIYSTSVNLSGSPSLSDFEEIYGTFGSKVDLVVKGREKRNAMASTIVDFTTDHPNVLREGSFSKADLKVIFPEIK